MSGKGMGGREAAVAKEKSYMLVIILSCSNLCHRLQWNNPVALYYQIILVLTLSPATPLCPTWPSSPFGWKEEKCSIKECRGIVRTSEHRVRWCGDGGTTYSLAVLSWRPWRTCGAQFPLERQGKGHLNKRAKESTSLLPWSERREILLPICTFWRKKNTIWVKKIAKLCLKEQKQKGATNCL